MEQNQRQLLFFYSLSYNTIEDKALEDLLPGLEDVNSLQKLRYTEQFLSCDHSARAAISNIGTSLLLCSLEITPPPCFAD